MHDREAETGWPETLGGSQAFAKVAGGSCAAPERLLLALAAEFGPVAWNDALDRLDELARPLFGVAALAPHDAAQRIVESLAGDAGLAGGDGGSDGLLLDRVLRTRRGHPALLAFVYNAAARRAGLRLGVFSGPLRWYAGLETEAGLVLIDPVPVVDRPAAAEPTVRRYCGHELAYAVLSGLAHRFERRGADRDAAKALRLRRHLPVVRRCPAERDG